MSDAHFDEVLQDFAEAARRQGLAVSAPELEDAARAVAGVGLSRRDDVKTVLATTLVKRASDRPAFDAVFERFFAVQMPSEGADADGQAAFDRQENALAAALPSGAGGDGWGLPFAPPEQRAERMEAAMRAVGADQIQSPLQVGLTALRALEELGTESLGRAVDALRRSGEGDEDDLEQIEEGLARFARELRERVRADFQRRNPERLSRAREDRLARTPLAALKKDEIAQVEAEVRRFAEVLRDRVDRRRRRSRRGELDVRQTMRSSLRTGGVPFAPVYRKRRRERPSLVVLCDVSDSVKEAARFLLLLVHGMQSAFRRTRSFVFVRDLAEVTSLFQERPPEEAVAVAYRGDAVNVGASTDYGHALGQFTAEHLDALDRRTTVVILGDGRTNDTDPNIPALALMQHRARRVLWLNPEDRGSWSLGDSAMPRYLPFVSGAYVVRTLADLRRATERVAALVHA